jgi:hypothetical protein
MNAQRVSPPKHKASKGPILARLRAQRADAGSSPACSSMATTCCLIPASKLSFRVVGYRALDTVTYSAELVVEHPRLQLAEVYPFTTRYSMVLKLADLLPALPTPFPPKLWWGNHDPQQLASRKDALEAWLNAAAEHAQDSPALQRFLAQVKANAPRTVESTFLL